MSDTVLIAIIAAVPGTLAAVLGVLNHRRIEKLDVHVDGRLTELLESTAKQQRLEGHEEGRQAEIAEGEARK